LYRSRRTLHTGADLLTDRQVNRLTTLFGTEDHVEVEATWGVYQRLIQAYRHENKTRGRELMAGLIESVSSGVPAALIEVVTLGRTLKTRAEDVLAYFERPGTSNGPTEAINGRLEHLHGTALGFRNLTNYIARSLLEAGGFRPLLHPAL
jgi:transposase